MPLRKRKQKKQSKKTRRVIRRVRKTRKGKKMRGGDPVGFSHGTRLPGNALVTKKIGDVFEVVPLDSITDFDPERYDVT
jgi:hypothetical protein